MTNLIDNWREREREREREAYHQLVAKTSRIDFPFDPTRIDDALGFFLNQYPEYQEQLTNPIVLAEFQDPYSPTYLIEAGRGSDRGFRIVYAKRLSETNVPRTKVVFEVDLWKLMYTLATNEKIKQILFTYKKIVDGQPLDEEDYHYLASFIVKHYPGTFGQLGLAAVLALIKRMPVYIRDPYTVKTSAPSVYREAGFIDQKIISSGANPFKSEK